MKYCVFDNIKDVINNQESKCVRIGTIKISETLLCRIYCVERNLLSIKQSKTLFT